MAVRQETSFLRAVNRLPVVDKDFLEEAVGNYGQLLRRAGVSGRDRRRAVREVETTLFDGNPQVVQRTLYLIQSTTNGEQANRS